MYISKQIYTDSEFQYQSIVLIFG